MREVYYRQPIQKEGYDVVVASSRERGWERILALRGAGDIDVVRPLHIDERPLRERVPLDAGV